MKRRDKTKMLVKVLFRALQRPSKSRYKSPNYLWLLSSLLGMLNNSFSASLSLQSLRERQIFKVSFSVSLSLIFFILFFFPPLKPFRKTGQREPLVSLSSAACREMFRLQVCKTSSLLETYLKLLCSNLHLWHQCLNWVSETHGHNETLATRRTMKNRGFL